MKKEQESGHSNLSPHSPMNTGVVACPKKATQEGHRRRESVVILAESYHLFHYGRKGTKNLCNKRKKKRKKRREEGYRLTVNGRCAFG